MNAEERLGWVKEGGEGKQADGMLHSSCPPPSRIFLTITAIFGLDVGGTLSKLVYFEQTRKSRKVERTQQQKRRSNYFDNPLKKATTLKRSASLENLNTPRHTKALDAFYDFMQAEGSPVRAELRDDNLTFFSRVLGGELHFMRFETRYMDRVVDIVKSNRYVRARVVS